jgi:hypothetical protein
MAQLDDLIRVAELPTDIQSGRRRGAPPTTDAIIAYWEPTLDRLDRPVYDEETGALVCWFCGYDRSLERAHILAVVMGGSDEVSNFHLLCHECHRMSEELYAADYWHWFTQSCVGRLIACVRWNWAHHRDECVALARAQGNTDAQIAEGEQWMAGLPWLN